MAKAFWQAREKLRWANHHVAQLHGYWDQYLQTDFCEIVLEDNLLPPYDGPPEFDTRTEKSIRIRSRPIPPPILLMIGDAIHNFRSALDYAINEILHWKSGRVGFPVHESREQLAASFRIEQEIVDGKTKKAGSNASIAKAVEGLSDFILDEVKPYKGGNQLLWAIARLDNTDKHRMLTVTAAVHAIHDVRISDGQSSNITIRRAIIEAGRVTGLIGIDGPGLKVESHGRVEADIAFAEAGAIEGEPVLPTLVNMLHRAAETIDAIEAFVFKKGWRPAA